jgi:hypothetical protein
VIYVSGLFNISVSKLSVLISMDLYEEIFYKSLTIGGEGGEFGGNYNKHINILNKNKNFLEILLT